MKLDVPVASGAVSTVQPSDSDLPAVGWLGTRRNFLEVASGAAANLVAIAPGYAIDARGAGATFPYPLYAKWADQYYKETGIGINYAPVGSSAGVNQVVSGRTTFGATDMPLPRNELKSHRLVQFPTVSGGVVPIVNIEGIGPGQLVLDGATLAKIYLGEVTNWNDEAIARLNPTIRLPSTSIVPVHRSDGSGTTAIFSSYLSKTSAEWRSRSQADSSTLWAVGLGAKGNGGVASAVMQTKNAIGYVEYAYARQSRVAYVALLNKLGNRVTPTIESFEAAASNANWEGAPGFGVVLTDEPGASSWPVVGATFILMHKRPRDPTATLDALNFFEWAFSRGDAIARSLDYVPIPTPVAGKVQLMWQEKITAADGRSIWRPKPIYKR